MSATVCLLANTIFYPQGGGHFWVYLNRLLGLRAIGCKVIWMERIDPRVDLEKNLAWIRALKAKLAHYHLGDSLALCSFTDDPIPPSMLDGNLSVEAAATADLLINTLYDLSETTLKKFKRTALLDIDPGLLQVWMSEGVAKPAKHDLYFTIGETVGAADAKFSSGDIDWIYTPPCVSLEHWPVSGSTIDAPFTTVTHWASSREWLTFRGETFQNDKRSGFLPYFDLPKIASVPIELAICQAVDDNGNLTPAEIDEKLDLQSRGWRIVHSHAVSQTPWDYQTYVQNSRGEFSCVKPSCVKLANAWISDRTLCYLASGKPCVIEHTGASRFLPDAAGLFRFRNVGEAAQHLEAAAGDYELHSTLARKLAEKYFDAKLVAAKLLERAIP